jgi:hypothetical protein
MPATNAIVSSCFQKRSPANPGRKEPGFREEDLAGLWQHNPPLKELALKPIIRVAAQKRNGPKRVTLRPLKQSLS